MNRIKSIWNYNCPRCQLGSLYKKPFRFSNPLDMNDRCSHCNQKFEPEPGFYYGAMFLSYIGSGWIYLAIALFFVFGLGWSVPFSFAILIAFAVLTIFKLMRLARSLWIHIVVKYDPAQVSSKAES